MRSFILLSSIAIILYACNGDTESTKDVFDLSGYETESIAGGTVIKAVKKNGVGDIIEKGFISNGKRNGVWMTFYDNEFANRVKTLASYSDDQLNGPYYEFSNRSQLEKEVNYLNNKYNGEFVQYKFGRSEKIISYKDNVLHGPSIDYNTKGEKQKEVHYKDGLLHGKYRTFNGEGKMTLEYEYKKGEKISGGIIE